MKTIFTFLVVCALGIFLYGNQSFAQQQPTRPSTTGNVRSSTNADVRHSTTETVRPSTTGNVRPSTTGTVRPSTTGNVRSSTNADVRHSTTETVRPSTTETIRPSTTGTVRPDSTRPQPRDTVPPAVTAIIVRTFPNPASVRLTVGFTNLPPTAERVTIQILNILGEDVASQTVASSVNEVHFDVSGLREGQYAVVVHSGRALGRAVVIVRH